MVTENTNRGVFSLNGVTGMLIATVLLLGILVVLTVLGIGAQQASATKYYNPAPIVDVNNLKLKNADNANFAFQDAKQ